MKNYTVKILPRVNILVIYWHPPGSNFKPKGHHWGQSYILIHLLKHIVFGIYQCNLKVAVWVLAKISVSDLVDFQDYTGIPRVVVIHESLIKNVTRWIKMGVWCNYHC